MLQHIDTVVVNGPQGRGRGDTERQQEHPFASCVMTVGEGTFEANSARDYLTKCLESTCDDDFPYRQLRHLGGIQGHKKKMRSAG